jgi:hypothetical protein
MLQVPQSWGNFKFIGFLHAIVVHSGREVSTTFAAWAWVTLESDAILGNVWSEHGDFGRS